MEKENKNYFSGYTEAFSQIIFNNGVPFFGGLTFRKEDSLAFGRLGGGPLKLAYEMLFVVINDHIKAKDLCELFLREVVVHLPTSFEGWKLEYLTIQRWVELTDELQLSPEQVQSVRNARNWRFSPCQERQPNLSAYIIAARERASQTYALPREKACACQGK